MSDFDEARVLQYRIGKTPELIQALRESAAAAIRLAEHLEHNPGDGLGLTYASVRATAERADAAMMEYQNWRPPLMVVDS